MSSPIAKTLGSRSISWPIASEMASATVSLRSLVISFFSRSRKHGRQRFASLRIGTVARELEGKGDARVDPVAQRAFLRVIEQLAPAQAGGQRGNWILLAQVRDLCLRAVHLGIPLEVPEVAVGLHFDERRALAVARLHHCVRH